MNKTPAPRIAVIGGGPAGLMAAEVLLAQGASVDLYEAKPSVGRKLLMAGKSGLNITHGEDFESFLDRFGARSTALLPHLRAFRPFMVKNWVEALGIETFEGTSGRVFPKAMKASPLLRAWLRRLGDAGLRVHARHPWRGWTDDGELLFETPNGLVTNRPDATVLALGGASWPRLGSTGAWAEILAAKGVRISRLRPANCGFDVAWSAHFRDRFAGGPVKSSILAVDDVAIPGDFVVTRSGVEGSAIYAHSAALRDRIEAEGHAILNLDLAPGRGRKRLTRDLARPRGKRSMANHLRKAAGIEGVKAGLLRECAPPDSFESPAALAGAIKALPLTLTATRPLDEAISSAGGLAFEALDERLMITAMPGLFAAGEMLDWEAPTGGYLISACLALGRTAGLGAAAWVADRRGEAVRPARE